MTLLYRAALPAALTFVASKKYKTLGTKKSPGTQYSKFTTNAHPPQHTTLAMKKALILLASAFALNTLQAQTGTIKANISDGADPAAVSTTTPPSMLGFASPAPLVEAESALATWAPA